MMTLYQTIRIYLIGRSAIARAVGLYGNDTIHHAYAGRNHRRSSD